MTSKKNLNQFVMDSGSGVFTCPEERNNISYSDGAENRIIAILKKTRDRTSNSSELEAAIDDWPTTYHFSSARANIIRAIDFLDKDSEVLEIGSGCGAITRFLGEHFKAVDSIEGDFKRACITRERCREMQNVRVFWSPVQEICFDKHYDIVTLIGILEYAPIFFPTFNGHKENSCLEMLSHARSSLREGGILILAIENRFGMKYWSGCKEDHTGKLFDGILGYVDEKTPITFSKSELRLLIEKAGFKHSEFYYPFPDYKLANTILKEVSNPVRYYLHNWINVPFEDYHGGRRYYFNEGLAVRSIIKGGLLYELANSFLVVASVDSIYRKREGKRKWIVKRYSTNRIIPFRTVTILSEEKETGCIEVDKQKMYEAKDPEASVRLELAKTKWIPGDLLQFSLYEAFHRKDVKGSLLSVLKEYHDQLMKIFFIGEIDSKGFPVLKPDAVDFVPWNIIKKGDEMVGFDQEWVDSRPISSDYVLFRSVHSFVCLEYNSFLQKYPVQHDDIDGLTISIIQEFYPKYDRKRQEKNKEKENEFHQLVSGRISRISGEGKSRIELDPLIEKEVQIHSILNSWSWKITIPLRWMVKIMGGR